MRPEAVARRARGFTLLEVLVAMSIVAVTLVALVRLAAGGTENRSQLESRTLAHWVALNRIAELRLQGKWPDLGSSDGSTAMAGRQWRWRQEVSATPDEDVRAVRVRVGDATSASLGLLTAYLAQTPGGGAGAN